MNEHKKQTDSYSKLVSQPCKYCSGEPIYSTESDELEREYLYLYVKDHSLNLFYENADPYESLFNSFEINYCPMCGRKLKTKSPTSSLASRGAEALNENNNRI